MSELAFVVEPVSDLPAASAVARLAADEWGLGQPQLLRHGMNAIFSAADVVLRVGHTTAPVSCAAWLAGHLRDHDVRVPKVIAARPAQPGEAMSVVAIERITSTGRVDWRSVGEMVRKVHDLDVAVIRQHHPLPWCATFGWWQLSEILESVSSHIDAAALDGISAAIERWKGWPRGLDQYADVVCHGDIHPGNIIQSADGPVLLDWDIVCHGPQAWDHAPMMTWDSRWGGQGGTYEALVAGYGESMRGEWIGEALAELRLIAATLMRVRAAVGSPALADEVERRLRYWRGDPDAPNWTAV